MHKIYISLLLVLGLGMSIVFAQTPTTTLTTTPITSPSPVTPTFTQTAQAPIVWLKLRRFFTRNQIERSELTLAIANALLTKMQQEQLNNNPDKALGTLEKFEREMVLITTVTSTIASQSQNTELNTFLDTLMVDETAQLTLLEATQPQSAQELSTKLLRIRAQALKDIVKLMEKDNLTPGERAVKLNKIMDKYTEKQTKTEEKIAKKLALKAELDDETDNETVENELEDEEDELIDEAADLDEQALVQLTNALQHLDESDSVPVLLKLKGKNSSKIIETAAENAIEKLEDDTESIKEVVKKLNKHADKEKLLEELEKKNEKVKKEVEKQRETLKKSQESDQDTDQETDKEDEKAETPKSSPKPTTNPSSSQTPTSDSEVEKKEIGIKIKDGKFETTNFTIKKNMLLTIKVKNEDPTNYTVTFSNGKSTGSLGQDAEKTLDAFTVIEPVSFSAVGVANTGKITVE